MNELSLTPPQSIILIVVCLVILVLLWRYESYIGLEITPKTDNVEGNTTDYLKERYWAYIRLSIKHYN
ncbi:hypothetical protein [Streptococcus gordonii]|uniref:hypothetical protein n=1 Tax=Streptococcus gordonii TaxID=1302 RepID=UPI0022DFAC8E|nr:hypothetical protein [Streptococcus gordonii]